MELHFERHGTPGNVPLVVLHGVFGSGENWRTLGRRLGARYDVVLVDQRNHGRSPHAERLDYAAMAADVRELLARLALDRPHLMGHSMGGKTAMELALETPAALRSLVVVDIAPKPMAESDTTVVLDAMVGLDPGRYASRGEVDTALAARLPSRMVRQFVLKNLARNDEGGGFRWQLGLDGIAASWAAIGAVPPSALTGATAPDLPTLVVRGERSDYVTDADLPTFRALFPRVEVATIAEAGHWVHAEQPDRFLAALEPFLQNW